MKKWRLFEFFAGGGMVHAAAGARWSVPFANDFSSMKAAAYRTNYGPRYLRLGDIGALRTSDLPGQADLSWASSPCQDVSLAGNGAGLGPGTRSGTFWHWWGLMEGLRAEGRAPRTLILENVTGLLTSNGGADLRAVCHAFASAGYTFGALVIDAELFLPHSRPRLFIVAVHSSAAADQLPHSPSPVRAWHPSALVRAVSTLSPAEARLWRWWNPTAPTKRNQDLASLIEGDSAVQWHTSAQTQRLLDMMQQPSANRINDALNAGGRHVGTLYRRTRNGVQCAEVRFDGISGCLRTPGGGSSKQTVVVVQRGVVRSRLLTPREGARLMGLPDSYRLPASDTDALHIIGDGVVVPVVQFLLNQLIEPALHAARQGRNSELAVRPEAAD
ncbi:DNA cytosine methyltransferase [Deinococcus sp. RIT780]|uniref:DNA cytosine methyltransferase n=1 Tax=Deinococcus sp. RIT780 TaxID=2870472 RepID=UPI001C895CDD|nr:DNA cytosine methyltransferase [Deinococcus sp. RIT780]